MTTPVDTELLELLNERLRGDVERITTVLLATHRREVPELPADEDLQDALREAVRADLVDGLAGFRFDRRLPQSLTFATGHLARSAAQSRMSLPTLLRLFRVGQRVVWNEICTALSALEPDPARREATLRLITDHMLEGGDRMSSLQTEEYLAERERMTRSREQIRATAAQRVLVDPAADASALDYDLTGEHLAIVAGGADAERMLRALAPARSLIVQAAPDVVWAWLGSAPAGLDTAPTGVTIGIGRPAPGRDGFVVGHQQARAAHAMGTALAQAVTRFDAVALEWLTSRDRAAARRFVTDELGALLDDDDRSARLLETLEAYLDVGYNASSMAARLGISVRTASYRIRSIEEVLGRTIASRNAELHTAVRLRRLLGA